MSAGTVPTAGAAGAFGSQAARSGTRFATQLGWNVASDLAARGASLWLAFYCARMLSVEDYGRFGWALAAAQTSWLAGDALLNSGYATRELARATSDGSLTRTGAGNLFWQARLVSGMCLSVTLAAIALVVPAPAMRAALIASAAYGMAYSAFPDWALRAASDFRTLMFANLAYALAVIALTAWWLPSHPSAAWAAGVWSASFWVAAAVALPVLARRGVLTARWTLDVAGWRPHIARSLVFSLGALAGIASVQLPLLITGAIAPSHEAGLFASASRLLLIPLGAFSVLWWPLLPMFVRHTAGDDAHRELVARAAALATAVAAPCALGCALFATPLLTLLFGPAYAGAARALAMGALALPAYVTCGLFEQVALASGGEALRLRIYALAAAVITSVAWLAVPRLGGAGASLALVAGFATAACAWGFALRGVLPWGAMARRVGPVLGATVLLAGVWLAAARTTLPPLVALVAGAGAFAAWAFGSRIVVLPDAGSGA